MAFERYIRLSRPMVHALYLTVSRILIFIGVLAFVLFSLNIYIFFSPIYLKKGDGNNTVCWNVFHDSDDLLRNKTNNSEVAYWQVHRWIALTLYWIVPSVLLPVFNIAFIVSLKRRLKEQRPSEEPRSSLNEDLLAVMGSTEDPSGPDGDPDKEVTVMLVTVTVAFILLTSGFNLVQVGELHLFITHTKRSPGGSLAFTVFILLFYLNHALNFFLYCFSVRTYRREFYDLFRNLRRTSST